MKKILQQFINSFLTNLPWKIAAFFMAFTFWFLIMNTQDPVRNETVTRTLELRNEDALAMGGAEGIHLENIEQLRAQTIRFLVSGTSRGISAADQNLRAYIDLSTSDIISAAQGGHVLNIPVQIAGYTGPFNIFATTPSSVRLEMDTITTVEMDIEVETEGNVAYGFVLLRDSVSVTPATIPVRGPSSIVNRIDRLVVTAALDGEDSTVYQQDLAIFAFTADGAPILSQHLDLGTANVELPILRRGIARVLQPQYHARPPDGFGIHSINWSPQYLDVAGSEEAIAALAPILMSPIPERMIAQFTADFIVPYDIRPYLPDGVFLVYPEWHTINVEVFVEPFIQQDFVIPRENITIIGLPPGAEVVTTEVAIRVSALQSVMGGIGTITPFVTALNLDEGRNEIPLIALGLPPGVELVSQTPMIVIYLEGAGGEENGHGQGQEGAIDEEDEENDEDEDEIEEEDDEEIDEDDEEGD